MKMRCIACAVLSGMILFAAASAFAQGDNRSRSDAPVNLSGRIYFQWYKTLATPDQDENVNSFELTRVYLTFDRAMTGGFSVLVTLDAGNDNGAEDTRYQNFLKYAYGQYEGDFGFGLVTIRTGLIPIAVSALLDGVSDYRWLGRNFIDRSADLIYLDAVNGLSLDTTADLGVGMTLALGNTISLDFQLTNGDGFKKTDESGDTAGIDDGKAYLAMLTYRPIQHLYLAGYFRYQTMLDHAYETDNYRTYAGVTVMYVTGIIRCGASLVAARASSKAATALPDVDPQLRSYLLGDLFANINLFPVIGRPLLVAARVSAGQTSFESDTIAGAADGDTATVFVYAAGVGWQFNEYYRLMAYYEDRNSTSGDIAALDWGRHERIFYIKSEIRF